MLPGICSGCEQAQVVHNVLWALKISSSGYLSIINGKCLGKLFVSSGAPHYVLYLSLGTRNLASVLSLGAINAPPQFIFVENGLLQHYLQGISQPTVPHVLIKEDIFLMYSILFSYGFCLRFWAHNIRFEGLQSSPSPERDNMQGTIQLSQEYQ